MNKNNKTYKAADFADYYAGTMPTGKMHELEKAALADSFLADALEGYAHTLKPVQEVEEIEKKLFKDQKKSTVSIKYNLKFFLQIAAVLIFVGIAGYIYNLINRNEPPNTVVQNVTVLKENKIDSVIKPMSKTKTIIDTATKTENNTPDLKNIINQQSAKTNLTTVKADAALITAKTNKYLRDVALSKSSIRNTQKAVVVNSENDDKIYFTQTGKVQDLAGAPIAFVIVKDKNSKNVTATDDLGRFKLKTFDSSAIVLVSSIGYSTKELVLDKNYSQNITLNNSRQDINDVVITGNGMQKKKQDTVASGSIVSNKIEEKVKVENIENTASKDLSTIKKEVVIISSEGNSINQILFNFIKKNKIPLFDDNNKPLKGTVRLSYEINKVGKLENISIQTSSCASCADQIITLLKNVTFFNKNKVSVQEITFQY